MGLNQNCSGERCAVRLNGDKIQEGKASIRDIVEIAAAILHCQTKSCEHRDRLKSVLAATSGEVSARKAKLAEEKWLAK